VHNVFMCVFDTGFDSTSNVLAGKLFDIPVSGTQAHSFVSSYNSISDVADQVKVSHHYYCNNTTITTAASVTISFKCHLSR